VILNLVPVTPLGVSGVQRQLPQIGVGFHGWHPDRSLNE
jgi:hypothetical protein